MDSLKIRPVAEIQIIVQVKNKSRPKLLLSDIKSEDNFKVAQSGDLSG